jgi:hypothetical protein
LGLHLCRENRGGLPNLQGLLQALGLKQQLIGIRSYLSWHKTYFRSSQMRGWGNQGSNASSILLQQQSLIKNWHSDCQIGQESKDKAQILGSEGYWKNACQMVTGLSCYLHAWPRNQVRLNYWADYSSKICHSGLLPNKSILGSLGSFWSCEPRSLYLLWRMQKDGLSSRHASSQKLFKDQ